MMKATETELRVAESLVRVKRCCACRQWRSAALPVVLQPALLCSGTALCTSARLQLQ
jgi:hypothetical protein